MGKQQRIDDLTDELWRARRDRDAHRTALDIERGRFSKAQGRVAYFEAKERLARAEEERK